MSVKIIIERKFREAPLAEDFQLINSLRTEAIRQRGYITEETLVNLRDKREVTVISYWASMDDWKSCK